jgi:hypothetical protein
MTPVSLNPQLRMLFGTFWQHFFIAIQFVLMKATILDFMMADCHFILATATFLTSKSDTSNHRAFTFKIL